MSRSSLERTDYFPRFIQILQPIDTFENSSVEHKVEALRQEMKDMADKLVRIENLVCAGRCD
eukprot:COSAG01_NODE_38911_length_483_cov_2.630208_1_plen_62_part_01